MRLWVKHARQVVRIISDADPRREYLAGLAQKDCKLAILEEQNGIGLSVIIDEWDLKKLNKICIILFRLIFLRDNVSDKCFSNANWFQGKDWLLILAMIMKWN